MSTPQGRESLGQLVSKKMDYTNRDMVVGSDGRLRPLTSDEVVQANQMRRQAEELSRQMKPDPVKLDLERANVEKAIRVNTVAIETAFFNSYLSLLTQYEPKHAYTKAIESAMLLVQKGVAK